MALTTLEILGGLLREYIARCMVPRHKKTTPQENHATRKPRHKKTTDL
jgi:hypothetical protein